MRALVITTWLVLLITSCKPGGNRVSEDIVAAQLHLGDGWVCDFVFSHSRGPNRYLCGQASGKTVSCIVSESRRFVMCSEAYR